MTVTKIVYLHCDDCDRVYDNAVGPGTTGWMQRGWARSEDGWLVSQPDGKDYCPECKEERQSDGK